MSRVNIRQIFKSGLLLRCPRCGAGPLFQGFFTMHPQCLNCALKFEREQGYFVGAIYLNYAATVLIALPGYFVLDVYAGLSLAQQLVLWVSFAVLFPLFFFRYSRSLWLSLDYFFNPTKSLYPVEGKKNP
jgi:uncharacterized protein (DUF983 family)